jgi:hypothetical protein
MHLLNERESQRHSETRRAAFDTISNLETKMGFTMRPGVSLVQIVEAHTSPALEQQRQQSFCFR